MSSNFTLDEQQIDAAGNEALARAEEISTEEARAALDICGTVRKVLPILKRVKDVVCMLDWLPGVGAACKALKLAIEALEAICP